MPLSLPCLSNTFRWPHNIANQKTEPELTSAQIGHQRPCCHLDDNEKNGRLAVADTCLISLHLGRDFGSTHHKNFLPWDTHILCLFHIRDSEQERVRYLKKDESHKKTHHNELEDLRTEQGGEKWVSENTHMCLFCLCLCLCFVCVYICIHIYVYEYKCVCVYTYMYTCMTESVCMLVLATR